VWIGGATAADVVTGRAAVVVAGAALVVVVGRVLGASTSRATEAVVVVDVLLDCAPPPQPLRSAETASAAIARLSSSFRHEIRQTGRTGAGQAGPAVAASRACSCSRARSFAA